MARLMRRLGARPHGDPPVAVSANEAEIHAVARSHAGVFMPSVHRIPGLSLLTLIAAAGCRSSDPLAGTWSNDTCFGTDDTPADIESCGVDNCGR